MIKDIDDVGLKLCKYQSDLFEKSINYFNCGSVYFIKRFMNSDLARRIDNSAFLLESRDIISSLSELNVDYKMNRGKEKYPTYVMSWIGYIYRYFSYTYSFNSKKVFEIVKPKELYGLYESYHSLDPKEAINRIIESKETKLDIDLVELAKKYYL